MPHFLMQYYTNSFPFVNGIGTNALSFATKCNDRMQNFYLVKM